MTKEELLRRQADHYLPCFANECECRETCLHWLAGKYLSKPSLVIDSVNPMHPDVKAGRCTLYRQNQKGMYAVGMTHFFDEMPHSKVRIIRMRLLELFTRKRFYEFRNGERPIAPEQQLQIAEVCREEGWNCELVFDKMEEDYLW